jgi:hypothetical protein
VTLAVVTLGPAALAIFRATRGPDGANSVAAGYGEAGFTLTVIEQGRTSFSGSIDLLTLMLLVAGPPILIWVGWLMWSGRDRRESVGGGVLRS